MIHLIKKFLSKNGFEDMLVDFEEYFTSHPNYPSVYAITDSLEALSIDNIAVKVPKEHFVELPNVFLAMYDKEMVLVTKEKSSVIIEKENNHLEKQTFEGFVSGWEGVVILVEPSVRIKEEQKHKQFLALRYVIPVVLLILFSVWFQTYTEYGFGSLFVSLLGVLVSVFIVLEKFGMQPQSIAKLCSNGDHVSCDSVIKSDQGKIGKWLEFSDLPLLFFGISSLAILMNPQGAALITGVLSLVSLPIVVYSLWIQQFKLKKWCLLCLGVSGLLVVQAVLFLVLNQPFFTVLSSFASISYFEFLFAISLLAPLWFFTKSFLVTNTENKAHLLTLKKFKRNLEVFHFLSQEIAVKEGFKALKGIRFGNPEAEVKLTIFLSPSCGHCHKAFKDALTLTKKFPEKVFLHVLFNINPENKNNPYAVVVENLLKINYAHPNKVEEAISDWHIHNIPIDSWKEKWQIPTMDMKTNQQIELQYDWCFQNNFNYTPVKIINNTLFPKEYDIEELKYFVNQFAAQAEVEQNVMEATV